MATVRLLGLLVLLHLQLQFCSALICPIYSSRQVHRYARHCQNNCSFVQVRDDRDACLGVFYNSSGEIFIKQLGVVHRDELCSRSNECLLDLDELNPQIFSCCCSTSNCTLAWRFAERTTTTTTTTMRIDLEETRFSWQFFSILLVGLLAAIFLVIFFWRSCCRDESSTDKSAGKSSSMENVFLSAEQFVLGKNSLIYKGVFHSQPVALKVYQNTHVSIWTNEMILLKSIDHESIIKILSDGQFDSHWFLILPFYESGTLQSFLRNSPRTLTLDESLFFIRSLVSAVAFLHLGKNSTGLTIVHRDIKSTNVLIGDDGRRICLTDFGMAAALPRILKEKDFVQIGTMRYMAPELLEGVIAHTREALCSVDIYALALVIWEIFSQTDVFLPTIYRPPYDEHLLNAQDRAAFSLQLYDIVVTRRLRPTLNRPLANLHDAKIVQEICSLIEGCWNADPDLRMNAQTLTFKLDQLEH